MREYMVLRQKSRAVNGSRLSRVRVAIALSQRSGRVRAKARRGEKTKDRHRCHKVEVFSFRTKLNKSAPTDGLRGA